MTPTTCRDYQRDKDYQWSMYVTGQIDLPPLPHRVSIEDQRLQLPVGVELEEGDRILLLFDSGYEWRDIDPRDVGKKIKRYIVSRKWN